MTIQQTIDIPADHRVRLEFLVPGEIPAGTAKVAIIFSGPAKPKTAAVDTDGHSLQGIFKTDGHDVDRFLARGHAERVRENWNDERQRQESLAFRERREPLSGEWVNPLLGIAKDSSLTVERFMEMQEEEIDLENEYDERQRQESEKYRRRSET
jgi:hypothetical protein